MINPDIPLLGFEPHLFKAPLSEYPLAGRERVLIGYPNTGFGRNGRERISNGEVTLDISYLHPDNEISFIPEQLFVRLNAHRDQFRVISALRLTTKSGQIINLHDLPIGWDSIFSIQSPRTRVESAAHFDFLTSVVSNEELLTPAGILVQAHEVGHVHTADLAKSKSARRALDGGSRSLSNVERDIVLIEEANAWAYAFNLLEPVLSSDPNDTFYVGDLSRFALDVCLGSYETAIQELYEQSGLAI